MDLAMENFGEYNTLQVEANYSKGKGLVVSFNAVTVDYSRGFKSVSFMMFADDNNNFKVWMMPMARNNKKKVAAANEKLEGLDGEKVVELYKADNKEAITEMVKEILN